MLGTNPINIKNIFSILRLTSEEKLHSIAAHGGIASWGFSRYDNGFITRGIKND